MAVLVVYFLEAVEIKNHKAQRQTVAARPIELFFERFGKESAVVKTRERISHRADLELLELLVFEDHGNTDQAGAR